MNSTPPIGDALPPEPTGRPVAVNAPGRPPGLPWLRWALLFYGGLGAVALAWNAWAGTPWAFADAAAQAAGVSWGWHLGLGLASAAGAIGLSEAITRRTRWGQDLAVELGGLLGPITGPVCVCLALLSGFAEEAFFRGALQPRVGWLWATLLFGLAHVPPRRALWPWTGFALLAGAWLGALFHWTGNLVAPISAHVGINAVNLWLLSRRYGSGPKES